MASGTTRTPAKPARKIRASAAMRCPEAAIPTIDTYIGKDGVRVVHVDTNQLPENAGGPRLRVYLNDGDEPLFANPEYDEGLVEAYDAIEPYEKLVRRGVRAKKREQEILREVRAEAQTRETTDADLTLGALRHFIWVQTLRGWKPTA